MKVLVAGSYPPVPGPAASASLAAVRAAWAAGDDVLTLSPRPSAADRHAHLQDWRAIGALASLCRHRDGLVLVVEPGMPFSGRREVAARALALFVRRAFGSVTIRLVSPERLSVEPLRRLWPAADRIITASGADRIIAINRLDAPSERVEVDTEAATTQGPSGITPFGSADWTMREQPRRIASLAIRKVLGKRTDAVRARVVKLRNRLRH